MRQWEAQKYSSDHDLWYNASITDEAILSSWVSPVDQGMGSRERKRRGKQGIYEEKRKSYLEDVKS